MLPAAFAIAENTANGTSIGTVIANETDVGDTSSFSITAGNTGGAFTINATTGEITVANSSALDFEAVPTFNLTVQVTDGGGLTDSATTTINLTDVNESPVVTNHSYSSLDGNDLSVLAPGVLTGSMDPEGSPLTAVLVSAPSSGSVTLNANGSFVYSPTPGFVGLSSFSFAASDGPNTSNIATVTISVGAIAIPPDTGGDDSNDDASSNDEIEDEEDVTESDSSPGEESELTTPTPLIANQQPSAPLRQDDTNDADRAETIVHKSDTEEILPLDDESADGKFRFAFIARPSALHVAQSPREMVGAFAAIDTDAFEPNVLWSQLDLVREEMANDPHLGTTEVGTVTVVTTTLTVGYMLWTLRGGYLVASLLSSLPAWTTIDPLPILETVQLGNALSQQGEENDQSLESIVTTTK